MSSDRWRDARAFVDVLRYEEAEHLFNLIDQRRSDMADEFKQDPDMVWRHKHGGRDLTHNEVYLDAVNDVLLIIDERLAMLYGRNEG